MPDIAVSPASLPKKAPQPITNLTQQGFEFIGNFATRYRNDSRVTVPVLTESESDFGQAKKRFETKYGPENVYVSRALDVRRAPIPRMKGIWVRKADKPDVVVVKKTT